LTYFFNLFSSLFQLGFFFQKQNLRKPGSFGFFLNFLGGISQVGFPLGSLLFLRFQLKWVSGNKIIRYWNWVVLRVTKLILLRG